MKTTIFVRNLPFRVNNADLETLFGDVGPIRKIDLIKDKGSAKSDAMTKGFAFIRFALESDAMQAVKRFNGTEFQNRKLCVDFCKDKAKKSATPEENGKKIEAKQDSLQEVVATSQADQPQQSERNARRRLHRQLIKQAQDKKDANALAIDRSIAIYGFSDTITQKNLWKRLKKLGKQIETLEIKEDARLQKRFAQVQFKLLSEAKYAVERLHEHIFKGEKLYVSPLGSFLKALETKNAEGLRLIVRNLSFEANDDDLQKLFKAFGAVLEARVVRLDVDGKESNEKTLAVGRSKGFAFVRFADMKEAKTAMDTLNGFKLKGREIVVDFAVPKVKYVKQQSQEHENLDETIEATDLEEGTTSVCEEEEEVTSVREEEESAMDDEDKECLDTNTQKAQDTVQRTESIRDSDEELERTLFMRNLSFETTKDTLETYCQTFGPVEYARIVYDHSSNLSKGVAFVRFRKKSSADSMLECAQATQQMIESAQDDLPFRSHTTLSKPTSTAKLLTASTFADDSTIALDGRPLFISRAVRKEDAALFAIENAASDRKRDKRNLYLAYEGTINVNKVSDELLMLPKIDIEKRKHAISEKKSKLKNPMYFISPVRLSIRNLGYHVDDKMLKQLARDAALAGMEEKLVQKKEVKSEYQLPADKSIPITIKMAKVIRATDSAGDTAKKKAKSSGFGFVEFAQHVHALNALRKLNNNPEFTSFAAGARAKSGHERDKSRLIAEFAIENHAKIKLREKKQQVVKKRLKEEKQLSLARDAAMEKATKETVTLPNRGARQRQAKRERKVTEMTVVPTLPKPKKVRRESALLPKRKVKHVEPVMFSENSRKKRKQAHENKKEQSLDALIKDYRKAMFGSAETVREKWFDAE